MKLIGKRGLSRLLEIVILVLLVVVPLLALSLPWSITWITDRPVKDAYYIRYFIILVYSAIMSELILIDAKGILHSICKEQIFTVLMAKRIKVMAIEFLILAGFYLLTMFWMSKFFMAVLFVCSVVAGLTLMVFSELFRRAAEIKSENDKTV